MADLGIRTRYLSAMVSANIHIMQATNDFAGDSARQGKLHEKENKETPITDSNFFLPNFF